MILEKKKKRWNFDSVQTLVQWPSVKTWKLNTEALFSNFISQSKTRSIWYYAPSLRPYPKHFRGNRSNLDTSEFIQRAFFKFQRAVEVTKLRIWIKILDKSCFRPISPWVLALSKRNFKNKQIHSSVYTECWGTMSVTEWRM